jgi:hypothetical protein
MSLRSRSIVAVAWLLSLVAVGAMAQSRGVTPLAPPMVVSGTDLGFRVEGRNGATPVGRLVIRVNGQWVDVEPRSVPQTNLLTPR